MYPPFEGRNFREGRVLLFLVGFLFGVVSLDRYQCEIMS